MSDIADRKQKHLDLCLDPLSQGDGDLFGSYALPYKALPELALADVQTATTLFGKTVSQPLIIASMTGGVAHARTINQYLAEAAEALQVAMGVGSQRIALEKEEAKETFAIARKYAPTAVLFANMGAVQLNYGKGIEDYQRVVDMIQADGLYLHLNPLQEAIQPEGDTDFRGLLAKIEALVKKISVPVIVKEVGHGIDVVSAQRLIDVGVTGVDCAGVGGTSWAWVEAKRAANPDFEAWFKSFGYPTDRLLAAYQDLKGDFVKIVSGGVRTPVQALKARALGADFYSFAQPLLTPALQSPEAVKEYLELWRHGLQIALFACGCRSWEEAKTLSLI